jgi:hypothetical protein
LSDKNLVLTDGQLRVASGWDTLSADRKNFLWTSLTDLFLNHSFSLIRELVTKLSDLPKMVELLIVNQHLYLHVPLQVNSGNICAGGQAGKGICNGDTGFSV